LVNGLLWESRPPCINRGFCNQGCLPNAKFSTLIHHIPKAIGHGAEVLSDCMVTQVLLDKTGKVTGVTFSHDSKEYFQGAKIVILSNFCIETPRLLLHSACPQFPDGLANSSGMVGKALMPHSGHDVFCKFHDEVRLYKGTPVLAASQEFYETDASRGFVRGYTLNAHGSRPLGVAKNLTNRAGIWGQKLYDIGGNRRESHPSLQKAIIFRLTPNLGWARFFYFSGSLARISSCRSYYCIDSTQNNK
jgi:choline dehydrogenase-like flavoprotein